MANETTEEETRTHYRNPEYVMSPINVGFIGWLLLLGLPALMLFLIYEKEQARQWDPSAPVVKTYARRTAERIQSARCE